METLIGLDGSESRPGIKAVFFDVGGTLIEPRYPVGEIYAAFAADFGFSADPQRLQINFLRLFPLQPRLAFSGNLPMKTLVSMEYRWWHSLVSEVFAAEGVFPLFDDFFKAVYDAFKTKALWKVHDGVVQTLDTLAQRGLRLGVVSNFDSRLPEILGACELADYFGTIRFSSFSNSAKPDEGIFRAALNDLRLLPEEVVHVGDSWREDVEGALSVGIRAILFDQHRRFADNPGTENDNVTRIERFDQLTELDYLQG